MIEQFFKHTFATQFGFEPDMFRFAPMPVFFAENQKKEMDCVTDEARTKKLPEEHLEERKAA